MWVCRGTGGSVPWAVEEKAAGQKGSGVLVSEAKEAGGGHRPEFGWILEVDVRKWHSFPQRLLCQVCVTGERGNDRLGTPHENGRIRIGECDRTKSL